MALSFATNTWHLTNWGFGAGDLVVLAGAGRNVITWMTASARDKGLFELFNASPTGLGIRGGLVNPSELNIRWGRELVLFQNGQRCERRTENGKAVEEIEPFTWIMTIIVTCLDVAMSNSDVNTVVVDLMMRLFQDDALNMEYLQRQVPQHVEGWLSTGITRNMTPKAKYKWAELERDGSHLPGFVPSGETKEMGRFLYWLVAGEIKYWRTASSDIFSLTKLLQDMGFDLLRTGIPADTFDEACTAVIFDDSHIAPEQSGKLINRPRSGMRIPFNAMEECVSIWPDSSMANHKRRLIFQDGMDLGSKISFGVGFDEEATSSNEKIVYQISSTSQDSFKQERGDQDAYRIAKAFLPLVTNESLSALAKLLDSWRLDDNARKDISRKLEALDDNRRMGMSTQAADLQVFLLGYYYAGFSQILDTSQLSYQEGFGLLWKV